MISWSIVFGFGEGPLLLIWLGPTGEFAKVYTRVAGFSLGNADHAVGDARDIETPVAAELEETVEPRIGHLLRAVTDVVTTQVAMLDLYFAAVFSADRPQRPCAVGERVY